MHIMNDIEVVVAGAGVIGLAIARALALDGREVMVLEAADAFGTVTSSRSSEVIHAGIYYPRGSLKARLCVGGREKLYAYCETHGVPHQRCGKLIVATSMDQTYPNRSRAWPIHGVMRSRLSSRCRITGVASVPWTKTDSVMETAATDHSHRSSGKACNPAAYAR